MNDNFLTRALQLSPVIIAILLVVILFVWLTIGIKEALTPTVLTVIIITILTPFQKEHRTIRVLIGAILFLYVAWFISLIASTLVPFLVAMVLAFIFDPCVTYLEKKGMSRTKATAILMLILFLLLVIILLVILPALIQETTGFVKQIPAITQKLEEWFISLQHLDNEDVPKQLQWLKNLLDAYREIPPAIQDFVDSILSEVEKSVPQITKKVSSFLGDIFSSILMVILGILNLLIIPVFMFYMLKEAPEIRNFAISLIPFKYKENAISISSEIFLSLTNYIRGQIIVACVIGTLSAAALYLLGIKYALLIGVIAGVSNIIPYLGPIIGATPAVLVALFKDDPVVSVISVIVAFAIIQTLESSVISPRILGESLKLPPLLIMLAIIVGGKLHGFLGMLLAIPCVCVLKVLFDRWYKQHRTLKVKLKKKILKKEKEEEDSEKNKKEENSGEHKKEEDSGEHKKEEDSGENKKEEDSEENKKEENIEKKSEDKE